MEGAHRRGCGLYLLFCRLRNHHQPDRHGSAGSGGHRLPRRGCAAVGGGRSRHDGLASFPRPGCRQSHSFRDSGPQGKSQGHSYLRRPGPTRSRHHPPRSADLRRSEVVDSGRVRVGHRKAFDRGSRGPAPRQGAAGGHLEECCGTVSFRGRRQDPVRKWAGRRSDHLRATGNPPERRFYPRVGNHPPPLHHPVGASAGAGGPEPQAQRSSTGGSIP